MGNELVEDAGVRLSKLPTIEFEVFLDMLKTPKGRTELASVISTITPADQVEARDSINLIAQGILLLFYDEAYKEE